MNELVSYWSPNAAHQQIIDSMSENTISNFVMPYSVAPNFLINGREYAVPMVIEESSVVAAASYAAKYWSTRGGFTSRVISMVKEGTVYFTWTGDYAFLVDQLSTLEANIRTAAKPITEKMEARGGGILLIDVIDMTAQEANLYKLNLQFDTRDSMGANFINSVLETAADVLRKTAAVQNIWNEAGELEVIMSILSNYTPQCVVEVSVTCPVQELTDIEDTTPANFARLFHKAVRIAQIDPARATTHNKGIFNGIDAVVLATGNDFRAIESCGHTYASRTGMYSSLSSCKIENDHFHFSMVIPLAVGTVGGLTSIHPMAKNSLELLGNPSAEELMEIIAATGLAQNFAAVRSLVTTGIQKGHMKMHLQNIAIQLGANDHEWVAIKDYFEDKVVSHAAVRNYLEALRNGQ